MKAVLRLLGRVPLSLRVALVVAPAIVIGQLLSLRLLAENRPVMVLRAGPGFGLPGPAPRFMPRPPLEDEWLRPFMERPHDMAPGLRLQRPMPPTWSDAEEEPDRVMVLSLAGPRPPLLLPMMMSTRLALIFGVTLVLVWAAAWWVTRPLARLARAAEELGRDIDRDPLPEAGPPEVRRAAAAFNRMQDRLLRFLRGRSDALLAMSHDLKTPITRLQLRLALLPEAQRAPIADDIALLQTRVEDALTFMRGVHSSDEKARDVDVQALAATLVEGHQDMGADASLTGTARPLRCRPGALERALSNVIDNAVRYGGHARVELIDGPDELRLSVSDTGPGVPDELLPRLTEPFFRVEASRNRDSGGTGLGLAICKDLVEAMGGRLELRNRRPGFEAVLVLPRLPG